MSAPETTAEPTVIQRTVDSVQIERGASLYRQYCASCHGARAEGDPGWQTPGGDGMLRAPPLNGTGHTWHHPLYVLREMITKGSRPGRGTMPAFEGQLTNQEVDDIIAWFQSRWPDEIYQSWYRKNERLGGKVVSP